MIGIVIPAHNEEQRIERCLRTVIAASFHPGLHREAVKIVVVLDACRDHSAQIARTCGVETLSINACNVGAARAAGADYLLACGTRWLAFTDADTVVSQNWIISQLELRADAVCGTVGVDEWSEHSAWVRGEYERNYTDRDGHRHIHGANLGVSAHAYALAGGFSGLSVSEDVALVDALIASGANIAWSASPRVTTSARKDFKIPGGFGTCLETIQVREPDAQLLAMPLRQASRESARWSEPWGLDDTLNKAA
ncbi:glycosyltransferase family 2 protein [Burkholderia sp. L27(2015)]|uniref:glycosyltransferase n=1 Tax=Burkholderia sp. L27(2015) TaxID=1641858 RepID=UPI00131CFE3B|nr:glycosyltransferase family A protein [Burkholderia sp. L27(2015)]